MLFVHSPFRCSHKGFEAQPKYEFSDEGEPHSKTFTCTARLPNFDDIIETATGKTKKEASSAAACKLYVAIEKLPDGPKAEERRLKREARKQRPQGGDLSLQSYYFLVSDEEEAETKESQDPIN